MKWYSFWFIPLFCVFLACDQSKPSENTDQDLPVDTLSSLHPDLPKQQVVDPIETPNRYAQVDRLRVRMEPNGEGEVLTILQEGDLVQWTGKISDNKETITLREKKITAPWYEVVYPGLGYRGWVFGGALTKNFPMRLIEDLNKKKVGEGAYKAGPFHLFELNDGRPLVLMDNISEDEEYFSVSYQERIQPEGYYLIEGFGYEYHFWLIVDPANGNITPSVGKLMANSDRQFFASFSGDLIAGFDFNGLQIFRKTDSGLELHLEHFMTDFEPSKLEWIDSEKLKVDRIKPRIEEANIEVEPIFFALNQDEWKLTN